MPTESQLYKNAVARFTDPRKWQDTSAQIALVKGPNPLNHSGAAIVEMIQTEHQLSPDPTSGDPAHLHPLLTELCSLDWTLPPKEIEKHYRNTMDSFTLRGRPLAKVPSKLFRYLNGPAVFSRICDVLQAAGHSAIAATIRRDYARARRGDPSVTWDHILRLVQDKHVWGLFPRKNLRLSGGKATFVTFDDPSHPFPRNSAEALHRALALWKFREPCFVEVIIFPRSIHVLQFPTLADAGWFRYFKSALPSEAHGWTKPHDLSLPRQPEAVMDSPTWADIDDPTHLRIVPK